VFHLISKFQKENENVTISTHKSINSGPFYHKNNNKNCIKNLKTSIKNTKKFQMKREVSTIWSRKEFFKKNMKFKVEEGRMRELDGQLLCVFLLLVFCINFQ
jgi:hypothetical protein